MAGLAFGGVLTLAGCTENVRPGDLQLISGFAGLVAADEPNAVVVGRDVLANNGTAVDAAVAMAFTMTVTLPSRAGLGSGGACILYDHGQKAGQALSFAPQASADGGVVPLMSRAMAVMHARYGFVRWELLVTPAENLARFGNPVSRALARDIEAARGRILGEASLRALFTGAGGGPLREGDSLTQAELSTVLSGIRLQGGGYLFSGGLPDRLSAAAATAGVGLSAVDIRSAVPALVAPLRVEVGPDVLFLPPLPASGGVTAGQLWQWLAEVEDWEPGTVDSAALLAEANRQVRAGQDAWLLPDGSTRGAPQDLVSQDYAEGLRAAAGGRTEVGESFDAAGAGFVVGDRFGNAVACGFSMNGLFGSGKVLEGTGIVLAAPPPASARGRLPLTMAILGNENIGRARLAASASAGDAAGIDLVQVLLRVLSEDEPPQAAVAAPRVRFLGGDTAAYELGLPGDSLDGLAAAGFDAKAERDPTLINLFFCPEGFVRQEEAAACAIATDPRGNGLAETVR